MPRDSIPPRREPLTIQQSLRIADELNEIRDNLRLVVVAIEGARKICDAAAMNGMSNLVFKQCQRLDALADKVHPPQAGDPQ